MPPYPHSYPHSYTTQAFACLAQEVFGDGAPCYPETWVRHR